MSLKKLINKHLYDQALECKKSMAGRVPGLRSKINKSTMFKSYRVFYKSLAK